MQVSIHQADIVKEQRAYLKAIAERAVKNRRAAQVIAKKYPKQKQVQATKPNFIQQIRNWFGQMNEAYCKSEGHYNK